MNVGKDWSKQRCVFQINRTSVNRVLVTITLVEFHSHGYMTVPSLWQYPDVAREYDWIDGVVDNCSLNFVSIENLKKA